MSPVLFHGGFIILELHLVQFSLSIKEVLTIEGWVLFLGLVSNLVIVTLKSIPKIQILSCLMWKVEKEILNNIEWIPGL